MASRLRRGKKIIFFSGLALIAALAAWLGSYVTTKSSRNTPPVNSTARERYQTLYDAAWRQDSARGTTLMTATLFVPPLIAALDEDAERSDTETQIWRLVRNLSNSQLAIFLTIDSIGGALADDTIANSLTLTADRSPALTLVNWHPIIAPSRVVNTNRTAASQSGVVIWQGDAKIDWSTIGQVQLISRNIANVSERVFTWATPRLLLQIDQPDY